jgi:hypothetical protein
MTKIPKEVYHVMLGGREKLFDIRPHHASPLFESFGTYGDDGAYTPRVPLPRGMTPSEWRHFDCRIYTCRNIIWEYTPGGSRAAESELGSHVNFEHMHMIGDSTYSHRFGSCMSCWKSKARRFDDADITPFPSQVGIDNPNLPRLGRCGCTICNKCVMQLEKRCGDLDAFSCPYCGNLKCFFKEIKIWSIGHEVFMEEANRRRKGSANVN